MAYKYSNPTYFVNTKDLTSYTCYSQGTSYGFRHIALKGIVTNPRIKKPDSKASCYNRTWERWQYESVLRKLTDTNELRQANLTEVLE